MEHLGPLETIGHVVVDSGQMVLADPVYLDSRWRREAFEDIRQFRHKTTGEMLQYEVHFATFADPIDAQGGKTMNELIARGDWEQIQNEPSRAFSYNGACQTTLSDAQGGMLGEIATVIRTGSGDGYYPVKVRRDGVGRIRQLVIDFPD